MCTLILAHRVFDNAPVAAAANRDEQLDRPARPPHLHDTQPPMVAPVDDRAGGTWIGYNTHHVFAAITNRQTPRSLPADRSRGLLVRDVLTHPTAADALDHVRAELDARGYDGFNLAMADSTTAHVVEWDGSLAAHPLDPGVHVVMNAGFDDRFNPTAVPPYRLERQRQSAHVLLDTLEPSAAESVEHWLDRAGEAISDHATGVCVHENRYGTRSSSLIALYTNGDASYRFAAGPPCRTPYRPVNDQL